MYMYTVVMDVMSTRYEKHIKIFVALNVVSEDARRNNDK